MKRHALRPSMAVFLTLAASSALALAGMSADAKTTPAKHAPSSRARQREQTSKRAAEQAAAAWLKLVDTGQYEQSWKTAAKLFQSQVTPDQWTHAARSVRDPLGKFKSRTLVRAIYAKTLPDAPPGAYVVIQYRVTFEKATVIETVTPMKDPDGKWRVSGYYVKRLPARHGKTG